MWPGGRAGVLAVPSVNTPVTADHVSEVLFVIWSCTTLADAEEYLALAAALVAAAVVPPRKSSRAAATEAEELEPGTTAVCEELPLGKPLSLLMVL